MFQNLNGATDEVELKLEKGHTSAGNTLYDTKPAVYHGNGASKVSNNNMYMNILASVIKGRRAVTMGF